MIFLNIQSHIVEKLTGPIAKIRIFVLSVSKNIVNAPKNKKKTVYIREISVF